MAMLSAPGLELDAADVFPSSVDSMEDLARDPTPVDDDGSSSSEEILQPPSPSPSTVEKKVDVILKLSKQQASQAAGIYAKLQSMEDRLTHLAAEKTSHVLRRKASVISKCISRKASKLELESPRAAAKPQNFFDDVDEQLGLKVMKAARKWRRGEGEGNSFRKSASTAAMGAGAGGVRGSPVRSTSKRRDSMNRRGSSLGKVDGSAGVAPMKPLPSEKLEKIGPAVQFVPAVPSPDGNVAATPASNAPILPQMASNSKPERAKTAKSAKTPKSPHGTAININGSTGLTQSGEASLSHLFKQRESQLIPASPGAGPKESPKLPSPDELDLDSEPERWEEPPKQTPKALIFLLAFMGLCLRLCGLNPLVQWKEEFSEFTETPQPKRRALGLSKAYHCLVLLLNGLFVVLAAVSLTCPDDPATLPSLPSHPPGSRVPQPEEQSHFVSMVCHTPLATDLAVGVGALLAVWSFGGLGSYFKASRIQLQLLDHLAHEVESTGLDSHWNSQKGVDALALGAVWFLAMAARLWGTGPELLEPVAAAKTAFYVFSTACLSSACYGQMALWRGNSLTVVAFARAVLEGQVTAYEAKQRWREVISCMRQTSRMFQLTAAGLALTIVLVFLGVLFDFARGRSFAALPTLAVTGVLPAALYVAASATAHCTRLPSLVCMLDGDEDLDEENMNLALFLNLSESGFFMWDTRVTLAVLQKFLYFTTAIVGSIGFQLKVFHL